MLKRRHIDDLPLRIKFADVITSIYYPTKPSSIVPSDLWYTLFRLITVNLANKAVKRVYSPKGCMSTAFQQNSRTYDETLRGSQIKKKDFAIKYGNQPFCLNAEPLWRETFQPKNQEEKVEYNLVWC